MGGIDPTITPEPTPDAGPNDAWMTRAWDACFVLNLPLPLLFGWFACQARGRLGLLIALALFHQMGRRVVARGGGFVGSWLMGAILVAVSQFIPGLQLIAGALGFALAGKFESSPGGPDDVFINPLTTVVAGFVATSATGVVLLVAATVAGLVIKLSTRGRW